MSTIRTAASRTADTPRLRRTAQVVLVVGSVTASAAAFGPVWATRVGVAVAVAAAVVACVCAWRELFHAERRHARTLAQTSQRHGAQLRDERRRNAEVVDTLTERVRVTVGTVEGQRVTLVRLRQEVATLEGERSALRTTVADRDRTITSLRTSVHKLEARIAALVARIAELEHELHEGGAELHQLPHRPQDDHDVLTEREDSLVLDFRTLETVRGVLPNYEADRRFA